MDRTSLINKYSRFDTPDIAERIAEKINQYIAYDGIEYLHGREIHGRHTGYLDISSGGFRNVYDFLWPVLYLCRVDCNGVVSADIRKIEKHLDIWRTSINTVPDDELDYIGESDFTEDDDIYAFRSAALYAALEFAPVADNLLRVITCNIQVPKGRLGLSLRYNPQTQYKLVSQSGI